MVSSTVWMYLCIYACISSMSDSGTSELGQHGKRILDDDGDGDDVIKDGRMGRWEDYHRVQ